MTSSLHYNIPDCVRKRLYKPQAPVRAPVVAPAFVSQAPTQSFINLQNGGHIDNIDMSMYCIDRVG